MGVEEIVGVDGRAAELGIKVEAAGAETTGLEDRDHGKGEFADIRVELVRVPAEQQVAGVRVNGAEGAGRDRNLDFVLESMAGESRVIGLDVELEVFLEAVGAEEGDAAGNVEVVLVLGGLLGLGFDEKLTLEANGLGIIHGHVQERREVVLLAFQVGVEECLVALAAAQKT